MPQVHFVNWGKRVRVGALSVLRRAALLAGVPIHNGLSKVLNCHGIGMCGTCRAKVEPGAALTPPTRRERIRGCKGPYRLTCQAKVRSNDADVAVTKMRGFYGKSDRPVKGPGTPD